MTAPDIFGYLDFRAYLDDWFTARKAANPRFSHRAFARRAGQASPSLLLAVIQGKRNLTPATRAAFSRAMDLAADEDQFFETLVELGQADSHEARNRAWERARATRRFREARRLDTEAVDYLSTWYLPALREFAACPGFRDDPAWIAARLLPRISPSDAAHGLELLERLGLLRRDAGGTLVPTEVSVATPHEVAGLAGLNYHLAMIERSRDALTTVAGKERHYCAVTVSVPASLLPRLKEELNAMQERLLDLCDGADAPGDRVYQINLQLFPLTRPLAET